MINKGLVCKTWKDGNLENFTVHMFAMHYYNRLLFEKLDSTIRITNILEEGAEIKYTYLNNSVVSELNCPEFILRKSSYAGIDISNLPVSSFAIYFKFGEQIIQKSQKLNKETELKQFNINIQIYENLKILESGNASDAFLNLAIYFSNTQALDSVFNSEENDANDILNEYLLAVVKTDSNGKIIDGICWIDSTQTFYMEYINGQIVKQEYIDLQNFQLHAEEIYAKMMKMSDAD